MFPQVPDSYSSSDKMEKNMEASIGYMDSGLRILEQDWGREQRYYHGMLLMDQNLESSPQTLNPKP